MVQKPFQFGYLSAKWMHELATKNAETKKALPANGIIDTGVTVIDKDERRSLQGRADRDEEIGAIGPVQRQARGFASVLARSPRASLHTKHHALASRRLFVHPHGLFPD